MKLLISNRGIASYTYYNNWRGFVTSVFTRAKIMKKKIHINWWNIEVVVNTYAINLIKYFFANKVEIEWN